MADPGFFASDSNRPGGSRTSAWKKGDRVLAPWEPTYLYAGTIDQVIAPRALIRFDDGDSGWVELAHVQPLSLKPGLRVMSRRRMGPNFFPGEIQEVDGEKIHVEFDDGKEERTTVASLRIPCRPLGRGADQVRATSHMAFLERLEEGDRVWALWQGSALFPGEVSERRGNEAHIQFDDGDEDWVPLEHLMPLDLFVGMFVLSRWHMGREFAPAAITDTEGERVQVRYEDGREEWTTAAALCLPLQPPPQAATRPGPPPRLESIALKPGWDPKTVSWIGILIIIAVAAFFYWLGHR